MNLAEQIVLVAERYAEATGRSLARVSTLVASQGTLLPQMKAGHLDFSVRRGLAMLQRLSDLWPDGVPWPADVERPAPRREAAE